MSSIGICISLCAVVVALCSVSAAIRYVGDQIKILAIKKEISTINEIKDTVDYLSELSKDYISEKDENVNKDNNFLKKISLIVKKGFKK